MKPWIRNQTVLLACCFAATAPADEREKPAADSMLGKEAGDVRDDNGLSMKLVWCPPGLAAMEIQVKGRDGLVESRTAVNVILSRGYWMGKYEVRQSEWTRLMQTATWKAGRLRGTGDDPDFPASGMEWSEAMEFCRRLTELERNAGRLADGWEYTLPNEAQWERACRARSRGRFCFGDDETDLGGYAWYRTNSRADELHPVGQKMPNAWGLHDMHGNAQEWCRDYFSVFVPGGRDPPENSIGTRVSHRVAGGTLEGYLRVVRGGAVNRAASECASGWRASAIDRASGPSSRQSNLGFRVTLTPVRPAE